MSLEEPILQASPEKFWFLAAIAGLFAIACFYLTFRNLVRSRLIADTPTSKIRSAAQGYTELEGRARLMEGTPIHAPLSGAVCAWYRYQIEEYRTGAIDGRRQSRWQTVESGISDSIFHLEDDTGLCIVDPEGADVTPSLKLCWRGHHRYPRIVPQTAGNSFGALFSGGRYRYTEERIQAGDFLYAIGAFVTVGSHETPRTGEEVRDLLGSWKREKERMLRRFDLDGNGEVDLHEWENAREQAEKEVRAAQRERAGQPQIHLLKKPEFRHQPFLLSTIPQKTLIRRYRLLATIAAFAFLAAGAAITWAIRLRR